MCGNGILEAPEMCEIGETDPCTVQVDVGPPGSPDYQPMPGIRTCLNDCTDFGSCEEL